MRRYLHTLIALVAFMMAGTASAQATRTWVSGVGDDVNPCSRTAPCKTFAGAISKTAAGGEISVLDPGGYGTLTITKSITLQSDGDLGSILNANTSGVIVNCAAACNVGLRNIRLNGAGTTIGTFGVRILAASKVTLEDVIIETSDIGVEIATSAATQVSLLRTTIRNVADTADEAAIRVAPTASSVVLTINDSQIDTLNRGVLVTGAAEVYLRNTTLSGGLQDGLLLLPTVPSPGPVISVMVEGSRITDFGAAGISASGGNTIVRVGDSTISGNSTGVITSNNAVVNSYGNNRIIGNVSNGSVSPTSMQ
ncbi:MAG: right-handed parallel beta-helix repeat-containing protein [Rhodanobacteraceae bacterium]|jgi:hypothetical protein|nr:right-handed parallel beta-helix repeat-containing protein [Rhodanobacteraceae bacterium]MBL0042785.1 right-handed parallel beta-helix repeat-containing protein [Xanthomonadales bacterium]